MRSWELEGTLFVLIDWYIEYRFAIIALNCDQRQKQLSIESKPIHWHSLCKTNIRMNSGFHRYKQFIQILLFFLFWITMKREYEFTYCWVQSRLWRTFAMCVGVNGVMQCNRQLQTVSQSLVRERTLNKAKYSCNFDD